MPLPQIGLDESTRRAVADLLIPILADTLLLGMLTRNAHWNIVGPHFHALHALFGQQYEALDTAADDIAERIRALGYPSPGSLAEVLQHGTLPEQTGQERSHLEWLNGLLTGHETVIRNLRAAIKTCDETYQEPATTDFLTGLLESHEKTAWMLRSHLG